MPSGAKPGERRGGRKKGSRNKVTASVKAALTQAFEKIGGVDSLVKWAKKNPALFYPLWARMLPPELKPADEKPPGNVNVNVHFGVTAADIQFAEQLLAGTAYSAIPANSGAQPVDSALPAPPPASLPVPR